MSFEDVIIKKMPNRCNCKREDIVVDMDGNCYCRDCGNRTLIKQEMKYISEQRIKEAIIKAKKMDGCDGEDWEAILLEELDL